MLCLLWLVDLPSNGLRYWRWGGTLTLFGSRENSKPEKYSKMPQNPQRPVHALLGLCRDCNTMILIVS
jgi:hypothetical protein